MIRIDRGMGRPKIEVDSVNFEPYRTQNVGARLSVALRRA
jgi:hypothetical protein